MENQYNYYRPDPDQPENHDPYQNPEPKKSRKQSHRVVTVIGLALLFGVIAGAAMVSVNLLGNQFLGDDEADETVANADTDNGNKTSLIQSTSVVTSDVSDIVDEAMPSLVSITNMSVQQVQNFFGGTSQQTSESLGTGIIISQTEDELMIVTNNHVIEGSETLTVSFIDDTSVEADIKGADSDHDIAVIAVPISEIDSDTLDAVSVATLGDSDQLKVGEPAIAIGNALGYGQSVTTGVISALNRTSVTTDETTGETNSINVIQTDAAINPGNSGGALLNASGEVIGINSAKLAGTSVEGVGYAIPVSDVTDLINEMMQQETRHKYDDGEQGYMGIQGYDVTSTSAQMYNMVEGVYVADVFNGSGAKKAGIEVGDIITGFEGRTIDCMDTLQSALQYYTAGETVTLTIQRPVNEGDYEEMKVEVTLGTSTN